MIGRREGDGAAVARCRVIKLIFSRDRQTKACTSRRRAGRNDNKTSSRCGADRNWAASAAYAARGIVGCRQRLTAGCCQGGAERAHARCQRGIGRQQCCAAVVACGEGDGAAVARRRVIELILSSNGETKAGPGRSGTRRTDDKVSRCRGADCDRAAGAADAAIGGVDGGQCLAACGCKGGTERSHSGCQCGIGR